MKYPLKIFLQLIFFFAFTTCKKDSGQSDIPNVLVDFVIYLNEPSSVNLNVITGRVYVNGGVRGIIIYRQSQDEFIAIERNCSYQPTTASAIVSVDSSNTSFLKDGSCGSRFYISDGSVANGPATVPLKRYQTSYNSTNATVHVYN
ncbi:MAG: hypothetical protein JJE25_08855 [Bacteroidia bacterium]|nr:hypothetical protein [Bacteroidia bacterium]